LRATLARGALEEKSSPDSITTSTFWLGFDFLPAEEVWLAAPGVILG